MENINKNSFLFEDITSLKGVGKRLEKYLKNKKVDKVKDLLLDLPYEVTDRSKITSLNKLEIGKITTIQVTVKKYNFPRIRNLPNKVICSDTNNKINSLKKKIIYRSEYRGIKEMDLLLGKFVKKYIDTFDYNELLNLYEILEIDDDTILKWYSNLNHDKSFPNNKTSRLLKEFKFK